MMEIIISKYPLIFHPYQIENIYFEPKEKYQLHSPNETTLNAKAHLFKNKFKSRYPQELEKHPFKPPI